MSAGAQDRSHGLMAEFAEALAQVIESMSGQRPEVKCDSEAEGPAEPARGEDMLWWEQPFQIMVAPAVWVGTPRAVWEEVGSRTLRAAGVESVEPGEARNTWIEILGQSLGSLAHATGALLGEEVTCTQGAENAPPADGGSWARIQVGENGAPPPVWILLGSALVERLGGAGGETAAPVTEPAAPDANPSYGRTMDLLLDVELPISISFGRTRIPLKDVLKLTTGSIVELNRGTSEPVEVLVNRSLIARGEVVVIDGNYGVKIQQIVSPEDRLRSLR